MSSLVPVLVAALRTCRERINDLDDSSAVRQTVTRYLLHLPGAEAKETIKHLEQLGLYWLLEHTQLVIQSGDRDLCSWLVTERWPLVSTTELVNILGMSAGKLVGVVGATMIKGASSTVDTEAAKLAIWKVQLVEWQEKDWTTPLESEPTKMI